MQAYNKLVAGIVGLCVLLINKYSGLDLSGAEGAITDAALAIISAWAIWRVPNKDKERLLS